MTKNINEKNIFLVFILRHFE